MVPSRRVRCKMASPWRRPRWCPWCRASPPPDQRGWLPRYLRRQKPSDANANYVQTLLGKGWYGAPRGKPRVQAALQITAVSAVDSRWLRALATKFPQYLNVLKPQILQRRRFRRPSGSSLEVRGRENRAPCPLPLGQVPGGRSALRALPRSARSASLPSLKRRAPLRYVVRCCTLRRTPCLAQPLRHAPRERPLRRPGPVRRSGARPPRLPRRRRLSRRPGAPQAPAGDPTSSSRTPTWTTGPALTTSCASPSAARGRFACSARPEWSSASSTSCTPTPGTCSRATGTGWPSRLTEIGERGPATRAGRMSGTRAAAPRLGYPRHWPSPPTPMLATA